MRSSANKDKIKTSYETTAKGIIVTQTSTDTTTVAALQKHAAEVTDLVQGGMAALHTAMLRNNGGMMQADDVRPDDAHGAELHDLARRTPR